MKKSSKSALMIIGAILLFCFVINEISNAVHDRRAASASSNGVVQSYQAPAVNVNFGLPDYSASSGTSVSQPQICSVCHGSGVCTLCDGIGHYSNYGFSSECNSCYGTGECEYCNGTGFR